MPKWTVDTPACSITGCGGVDRRFARTVLSTADIVRVKDAAGVTFNHVGLAVVASGLRKYLADRGDLPDRPLTALVPVSGDALAVTTKALALPDPGALTDMFGPALAELLACVDDHQTDCSADQAKLAGSSRSRVAQPWVNAGVSRPYEPLDDFSGRPE